MKTFAIHLNCGLTFYRKSWGCASALAYARRIFGANLRAVSEITATQVAA
jgi:hypothetical protein